MAERRHAAQRAESGAGNVTQLPEQHDVTKCDRCRQWDDHPKLHYGAQTMHHDCADEGIRADVFHANAAHSVSEAATRAAFEGADNGLRGHDLRAHIRSAHQAETARLAAEAPAEDQDSDAGEGE